MRITFVLPHAGLAGGIRVVAIYAERLKRGGHDVFVVSTPKRQSSLKQKLKSLAKGNGWPAAESPGPSHFDGLNVPRRVLAQYRPVTDSDVPDADVVVATWWETAEWVAALSSSKGAKAYFIQHDERVMTWEPNRPRVAATWRLPMHKITISQWLVDLARAEFGDNEASLVPNSVDLDQFHAPVHGKQSRPTVGMLYSTVPFKGCDISLRALELVRASIPNLHLIAYGAEPISPDLPLPAGAEFHLRPEQSRIRDIYAQCDVWLCGSRSEGFHLPPLEAMACRCPVVSTRVGGALEIIQEGVNGHLVAVGDPEALAKKIVEVLHLPGDSWMTMSEAAHATAQRYTWEDATTLFEKALVRATDRAKQGEMAGS